MISNDMDDLLTSWKEIARLTKDELLRRVVSNWQTGLFDFTEPGLGGRAGFTTQIMAASFLSMHAENHVEENLAQDLGISALDLQANSGGILQPYNVAAGEDPFLDIVEFASCAGNLAYLAKTTGDKRFVHSLTNGADYLLDQRVEALPGAIQKNPKTVSHDVINASAYAANAWGHAFRLTDREDYFDAMLHSVEHLIRRWSQSEARWWNYAESWTGEPLVGKSVAYQASILALISEILEYLPREIVSSFTEIQNDASSAVVEALNSTHRNDFEAPSWSQDWCNVFEIDWFLSKVLTLPDAKRTAMARASILRDEMSLGIRIWANLPANNGLLTRSMVTTDFRKIANLAGVCTRLL